MGVVFRRAFVVCKEVCEIIAILRLVYIIVVSIIVFFVADEIGLLGNVDITEDNITPFRR